VSDEVTKDFVDRAIRGERDLTDEKFKSRDLAIKTLAEGKQDRTGTVISVIAVLVALASMVLMRGH